MAVSSASTNVIPDTVRATEKDGNATIGKDSSENTAVSNEFVLNVAFLSFLVFTTVQFFFAILARSQSMMADCAAMSVDVISYFVNFLAERLKHGHTTMAPQQLRLKRLYLELIPPGISVITLIVVTAMALRLAIGTLMDSYRGKDPDDDSAPDLNLMIIFSACNLLLDFMNVSCFARADQALGLPGQHGKEDIHLYYDNHHAEGDKIATETTPLVDKKASPQTQSAKKEETSNADLSLTDSESEIETNGLNLNMCSAWTHVCADTLRSIAVLIAAGFSYLFPEVLSPVEADSWGAVVVSLIILVSLAPLIQGLYATAVKIREIWIASRQSEGDFKNIFIEV
mmetsp:Transcript_3108/g.4199  ORF Transcript_3108/g.4199 Transcript_3108/m.4199 type:complete len:342 (-) Transcript_3108:82-1107(-)